MVESVEDSAHCTDLLNVPPEVVLGAAGPCATSPTQQRVRGEGSPKKSRRRSRRHSVSDLLAQRSLEGSGKNLLLGRRGRARALLTSGRSRAPHGSRVSSSGTKAGSSDDDGEEYVLPQPSNAKGSMHLHGWMPRGKYKRIASVLGAVVAVEVILSVFREAVLFSRLAAGCQGGHSSSEGGLCRILDLYWGVDLPGTSKQVIGCVVLWGMHELQCHRIRTYRRLILRGRQAAEDASADIGSGRPGLKQERHLGRVAGHWTPVASEDIYRGTAATIVDVQFQVLSGLVFAMLMALTSQIRVLLSLDPGSTMKSSATLAPYVVGNCCPAGAEEFGGGCSRLCLFGITWMDTLLTGATGLLGCLMCTMLFIPEKMWSPLTQTAMKKTGDFRLGRVLMLPPVASALALLNGLGMVLYLLFKLLKDVIVFPTLLWEIFAVAAAVTLLIEGCVVTWCLGLSQIASGVLGCFRFLVSPFYCLLFLLRGTRPAPSCSQISWSQLWQCSHSWRYRQLVLLYVCIYAYGIEVTDSILVYEVWVARIVVLVLLLAARDQPSDFQTLKQSGAGFGLVVDAKNLQAAVRAHMAGTDYSGPVRKYKGTILRMEDTMAVSYRWNEANSQRIKYGGSGRTKCHHLGLNMSDWQLSALSDAIDQTQCLYVWLDVCSVPQNNANFAGLKRTLLARMMAVYASAFITLTLLSGEPDGERYHQRTWTLQEYCASQQMLILTEDDEDLEDGMSTVQGSEGIVVQQLRREHMKRQPWSTPVWLASSVHSLLRFHSRDDARRIRGTYESLSHSLACRFPVDSIRALYPLLWNTPAESEEELIDLVKALQEVHGIPQDRELNLLSTPSSKFCVKTTPGLLPDNAQQRKIGLSEAMLGSLAVRAKPKHWLSNAQDRIGQSSHPGVDKGDGNHQPALRAWGEE